jgi:alpha-amylase
MKNFITYLLLIGIISACAPSVTPASENTPVRTFAQVQTPVSTSTEILSPSPEPSSTLKLIPTVRSWWQDAVFYEIFVRSFCDSNGDGIGDLNGITQKLDYLQELGVNALWLMPIFPSPSYHGYDVTDYFNVNPQYGTLDDLKNLLNQAHQRKMHIILDLILDYTSAQNTWFIGANEDTSSSYRDWYLWSDTDPGTIGAYGGPAWTQGKQGYYYAYFGPSNPDLNYNNPAVTAEMEKVTAFWLKDIGVDGFRLDAIPYLIPEGIKISNTKSTHDWLKRFYTTYKTDKPDAFTVGEIYGGDATLIATYTGDQVDMAFNFELASSIINSANGGTNSAITSALTFSKQAMPDWQFATFLTNHDQDRIMSDLNGNIDKAKMAAFLLLTAPGTPFIYYGEEIGMEGSKPDPDIRRPMQWTPGAYAGFTSGTPWEAVGPGFQTVNVSGESSSPVSLLSFYQTMLKARAANPLLNSGGLTLWSTGDPGVYATLRYSDNVALLVLANLTGNPISSYTLNGTASTLADGTYHIMPILGAGSFSDVTITGGKVSNFQPLTTLPVYGKYILEFKQ